MNAKDSLGWTYFLEAYTNGLKDIGFTFMKATLIWMLETLLDRLFFITACRNGYKEVVKLFQKTKNQLGFAFKKKNFSVTL